MPFCHVRFRTEKPLTKDYPSDPETLGEHLLCQRKLLRHTQRDVAEQLGVNPWTVRNWEKGRNEPTLSARPALHEYLGFCPADPAAPLGSRIRLWREAKGVSRRELCRSLGLDEGTLKKYEMGKSKRPSSRVVALLLAVLLPPGGGRPCKDDWEAMRSPEPRQ